jgi:hypothetical protein
MLHGEGGVPGKFLTRSKKSTSAYSRTMSWNSSDDSVRGLLFFDSAYAIDKYK